MISRTTSFPPQNLPLFLCLAAMLAWRRTKGCCRLRIVTWNCNGGFWRKHVQLSQLCADILVIQECNDPARSKDKTYREWAGENYAWIGQSAAKGLGIFSRINLKPAPLPLLHSPRFFLPVKFNQIPICGVWAHKDAQGSRHYCGQTHSYLLQSPAWLDDPLCIFLGDMNASCIWDRPNRVWNHSAAVQLLQQRGIVSAYHHSHETDQGAEHHPSFFLHRNRAKPYHIDYVFYGRGWAVQHCDIGAPDQWLAHSDHMPLMVDLTPA